MKQIILILKIVLLIKIDNFNNNIKWIKLDKIYRNYKNKTQINIIFLIRMAIL